MKKSEQNSRKTGGKKLKKIIFVKIKTLYENHINFNTLF